MNKQITVRDWFRLDKHFRPKVGYKGEEVKDILRDLAHPDEERYVIRCGYCGYGGKRSDTELQIVRNYE